MTTLHLSEVNGLAVMPREEFDKLLELARRSESVEVQPQPMPDVPTSQEMARLAGVSSAWTWLDDEPDLYSRADVLPQ